MYDYDTVTIQFADLGFQERQGVLQGVRPEGSRIWQGHLRLSVTLQTVDRPQVQERPEGRGHDPVRLLLSDAFYCVNARIRPSQRVPDERPPLIGEEVPVVSATVAIEAV